MKGLIEAINAENLKSEVPEFNVGDTVKVGYKIIEGGKERVQNFEGVVIAKKNGGIQESFTVRHISYTWSIPCRSLSAARCLPCATASSYIAKVGESLGLIYGYEFDGVYQYDDFYTKFIAGFFE